MSAHPEQQYLDLLRDLIDAPVREDRTGTGVRGIFDHRMIFDLADGFPLLTTKRVFWRGVVAELIWFLRGDTNAKWLEDQGVNIWADWGDPETREMGPIYGKQWRSWAAPNGQTIDQIQKALHGLRTNPFGRRHIVSAWNPADVDDMALPPCHCLFQFYIEADGRLSMKMYQRSADVFLGVPFNIASYALLLQMFAAALRRPAGRFIWDGGDVHLYLNHEDQAREQVSRTPRAFPTLDVSTTRTDMDHWASSDFELFGYDPHPTIKAEVSA